VRVLVTGAAGQLGGDLLPALAAAGHQSVGVDRTEGDMARDGVAALLLQRHRPDAVVNCAAYNAVDRAEAEPEAAMRVNAHAPDLLAQACSAAGVLMCHLSTDFVFDGQSDRPYDEADVPQPLSIYARSKRAGEEAVLSRFPGAVVVRTAWLFGRTGPNFILSVLRHALDGGALKVVATSGGARPGPSTWRRRSFA
jgi:dTDP-4-dehydrorhamnose reductase